MYDNANFQVSFVKNTLIVTSYGKEKLCVETSTHNLPKNVKAVCAMFGYFPDYRDEKLRYKKMYEEFFKDLGITPSNALKVIRGAFFREVVAPVEDLISKYGFSCQGVSSDKFRSIVENEGIIRQAEKDGLHHLIPFIVKFRESPRELRKRFGKGFWKELCKNSKYRNRILSEVLPRVNGQSLTTLRELTKILPTNRLSLLKGHYTFEYMSHKFYREVSVDVLKRTSPSVIDDLLSDAETLNVSLLTKTFKSSSDIVGYHHLLNRQIRENEKRKILNKEEFGNIEGVKRHFEKDGIVANLLVSPYEVHKEGQEMKHCVSGYIRYVEQGNYLVYHLRGENETATLGIKRMMGNNKNPIWGFDQLYQSCNRAVEEEGIIMLSKEIISELNKEKV